jgi:hypothetical protein
VASLDPEDYYDMQVNRPRSGAGGRRTPGDVADHDGSSSRRPPSWTATSILVDGIEPSIRWRSFVGELLDFAVEALGVQIRHHPRAHYLADVPHTRPIPVNT